MSNRISSLLNAVTVIGTALQAAPAVSNRKRIRFRCSNQVNSANDFIQTLVFNLLQDPVTGTGTITQTGSMIRSTPHIRLAFSIADLATGGRYICLYPGEEIVFDVDEDGDMVTRTFFANSIVNDLVLSVVQTIGDLA